MARGRMISKSLSTSERWAALYPVAGALAEFCQSLFPLLVAHADDAGRLPGDLFTVKHLVIPASPRKLPALEAALVALARVGLIDWYSETTEEPPKYIQIQRFEDHQYLKGHEARPSKYPANSHNGHIWATLGNFGQNPALKRIEPKRNEEKGTEDIGVTTEPSPVREFLDWFQAEYKSRRHGAVYFVSWAKHGAIVKRLMKLHSLERLKKHAKLLLATNEPWTEGTDRGIEVLGGRINWLEERLAEWEKARATRET